MSAFICSPEHIAALATFGEEHELWGDRNTYAGTRREVAEELARENVKSVEYRYPDDKGKSTIEFLGLEEDDYILKCQKRSSRTLNHAMAAKLMMSYAYQTCEHREWPSSPAYQRYVRLIEECARHLSGYEDAPWSI